MQSQKLGDGWVLYTNIAEKYSLELPETWLVLDLTLEDLEAVLGQLSDLNPEIRQVVQLILASPQLFDMSFYGIDSDPGSFEDNPSGTSANIIRSDMLAGADPALLLGVMEGQMALWEGFTVLDSSVVEIGNLRAARLDAEVSMIDPLGREVHNRFIEVYIPTDETTFALTVGTAEARFTDYSEILDRIIESFRLVEKV